MRTGLLVLVNCDEVNRENRSGLRIFHVGGSTASVGEWNGMFKMTGVEYTDHSADRFGACDHFESTLSGIRYALVAGGCFWREDCGVSYLSVNDSLEYANLADGACDLLWRTFSGLRYALYGGECSDDMFSGWSCLFSSSLSEDTSWGLGA